MGVKGQRIVEPFYQKQRRSGYLICGTRRTWPDWVHSEWVFWWPLLICLEISHWSACGLEPSRPSYKSTVNVPLVPVASGANEVSPVLVLSVCFGIYVFASTRSYCKRLNTWRLMGSHIKIIYLLTRKNRAELYFSWGPVWIFGLEFILIIII
jgi:hypothetical protein